MKASKTIVWKDPNGDEFTLQEMIDELMILRGVNVNLHALLYKDKVKIGLVADAEIKVRQSYFQDLIDESARKRKIINSSIIS